MLPFVGVGRTWDFDTVVMCEKDAPIIVDTDMERVAIRKLDWHIIPMVMWIYLMNFMDRGLSLVVYSHTCCTNNVQSVSAMPVFMVSRKNLVFEATSSSWQSRSSSSRCPTTSTASGKEPGPESKQGVCHEETADHRHRLRPSRRRGPSRGQALGSRSSS